MQWTLEEAPHYRLSGEVTYKDGSPVPFAYVRLQNTPLETIRTDENGLFNFGKVPEGSYQLSMTGKDFLGKEKAIDIHEDIDFHATVSKRTAKDDDKYWRTLNHNIARNAMSPEDIAVDELENVSDIETAGSTVFSSPAVNEDTIVVTTEPGRVQAIDREKNEIRWTYQTGIMNRGTPTIVDDIVYVTGGQDGKVYALDLMTGTVVWDVAIGNRVEYETPLYDDGTLYLSASIANESKVVALDAETGEEKWSSFIEGASYFGAAISGDHLLLGSYEGQALYSLSKEDGSIHWTYTIDGEGFSTHPVVVDEIVYAVSTNMNQDFGTLRAIDLKSGEEIWNVDQIGDTQAASPVVYDDIVIMSSATNPSLKAFDRHTGAMLWENKHVNTALNNGAVSSNGVYFIVDDLGMLHAIDVLEGDIINQWNIDSPSSSTPAIVSGELIISSHEGVKTYEAPSYLKGKIEDESGNPVQGYAQLIDIDHQVEADEEGKFTLQTKPGEYDVKIGKYGFEQQIETLDFRSGYTFQQTYTLSEVEAGQLFGHVKDQRSGDELKDVHITVINSPLKITTDENGDFHFNDISAGSYNLRIEKSGYVDKIVSINIDENEETHIDIDLEPVDVAVLNDYEGAITNILNQSDISAEEQTWDAIVTDVSSYQVIYLNGAYGSDGKMPNEDDVKSLVHAAEVHDVSLVFADTWGPNYGSIQHLRDLYNDPEIVEGDYNTSNVTMHIDKEHPILANFEQDEKINVIHDDAISWFNNYSGNHIATVGNDRFGKVGSGIAYKAITQNSAHLLLSNHAASSWNLPTQHWNRNQLQILMNSINYLLDESEFGQIKGKVVDEHDNPLKAKVEVVETDVYSETKKDGTFEIFHDEGEYELAVRVPGYQTSTVSVEFEHDKTIEETIVMNQASDGNLSGTVTDQLSTQVIEGVEVTIIDEEGEELQQTTTNELGVYELEELEASSYTIQFLHDDYVLYDEKIEIIGEPKTLDVELTPSPNVAILGDRSSGLTIEDMLAEDHISATNYTAIESLFEEIAQFDVVFYNDFSGFKDEEFKKFESLADDHGVSIIYGDSYFSGGGITTLSNMREDPAIVEDINIRSSSAQYEINESHPIFGDAQADEIIDILTPDASRVTTFSDYTGFMLADVKHAESDAHGPGVAFMPRTSHSLELLMSGHNNSLGHYLEDYTEEGLKMFKNAIVWAAHEQFPVIQGKVTNESGEPLDAEVRYLIDDVEVIEEVSNKDGVFEQAMIEGEVTLIVSSFGYETKEISLDIDHDLEPLEIELSLAEGNGHVEGVITDQTTMEAVEGAHINIDGYPREGITDEQGRYLIENIETGTYDAVIYADDYVQEEVIIEIKRDQTETLDIELRPSPTVGIIVDSQSSSGQTLSEYLEKRGLKTVDMFYDDFDLLDEVDLVFANSDYNNDLIPDEEMFQQFLSHLDQSKTSVIWTGQHGGRGSIRYLVDYIEDPAFEFKGSEAGTQTATLIEDHPIFEDVDDSFEFTTQSNYYYGFDEYSGTILADYEHSEMDEVGKMIGFKGRTTESVEILLAGMTFGHAFHAGHENFDENREKILYNSILWAIDHKGSYAGEIEGVIKNDQDQNVMAEITVEETGYMTSTDENGEFFLGLPEGEYTLHIDAFGHSSESFTVDIENGEVLTETFSLQSEPNGEVRGSVESQVTVEAIEGATIEILNTPNYTITDDKGNFSFHLPEGSYVARIFADGYQPQTIEFDVTVDEETEIDVLLAELEEIALVGSEINQDRLGSFLESYGYELRYFDRNEMDEVKNVIDEFSLVILNDAFENTTEENFHEFLETSDEAQVSIIFTGQYSGGSISQLEEYVGDPENTSNGFVPNEIRYEVLEEHPIFAGYELGESFSLLERKDNNQQYQVFERYSGTTLADITDEDDDRIGSGLAYDFRSSQHVHVLLGSLSASLYGHPEDRWTEDAKTIYVNAIDWAMNASQGEIYGTVTNKDHEPIEGARVTVQETNETVMTDENGEYTLSVGIGTYTITAQAIGYDSEETEVEIESVGDRIKQSFELEDAEQLTLFGQVTEGSSDDPLADVYVEVISKEDDEIVQSTVTDENGEYMISNLIRGSYEVNFSKEDYHGIMREIEIDSEDIELNVSISSYHIAVLGDYRGMISELLTDHNLPAEQVDWSVVDDIDNYDVIIVNDNDGQKEDMESLIHRSDEHEVSLVFLDTWGAHNGSFHLLEKVLGYPQQHKHGYDEDEVYITVQDDEHPIFDGFDLEEHIRILAESSPYATFQNYEGNIIADLTVGEEEKGASIGYEFRSNEHMHLLLSSFAVNNMVGPEQGWTKDGKQLFVQAIDWAQTATNPLPSAPVWEVEKAQFYEDEIIIEGVADPGKTVKILEDDHILTQVVADEEGNFVAHLDLDLGEHWLVAEVESEEGSIRSESEMYVLVVPRASHPVLPPGDKDRLSS